MLLTMMDHALSAPDVEMKFFSCSFVGLGCARMDVE